MAFRQELRVFPTLDTLSARLAATIATEATSAKRLGFSVVLTGGRAAHRLFEALDADHRDAPWELVDFFWSDERLVPANDPESNVGDAREAWLSKTRVPLTRIHAPRVEPEDPESTARSYEATMRHHLDDHPSLGCVLLSLGEDGHIASLFPGYPATRETTRLVVAVPNSPKPPRQRITMTVPLLNRGATIHLMAAGGGKAAALRDTLEGPLEPARFPAQGLQPAQGRVLIWADEAAAAELGPIRAG